jgi:hypothetical protein
MLMALILICSATVVSDIGECTAKNARTVMRVPAEFGNPIMCFMHAQAYVAETSFGRELDAKDRLRIMCLRREEALALHWPQ